MDNFDLETLDIRVDHSEPHEGKQKSTIITTSSMECVGSITATISAGISIWQTTHHSSRGC